LKEVRKPKETAEILQGKKAGYPLDRLNSQPLDKFLIRELFYQGLFIRWV
jgi:hypothetical protein